MRIVFFDAYNLIHRARHSTPPYLRNSPNGITFTFFRSFAALYRQMAPDVAYFVIEGTPKRRLLLHPEYKANRITGPDDGFIRQKNEIIELMKNSFPIQVVQHPEFECDDVIAHLAMCDRWAESDECIVVSTDTDFLQLANEMSNFKQYDPIRKKYKELPDFPYVRWKALRGDSSDNISGFKGIGDKRAMKLISDPALLETFLAEPGRRELFDKNIELINFHNLDAYDEGILYSEAKSNWEHVKKVFTDYSFSSIVKEGSWIKFVKSFGGK